MKKAVITGATSMIGVSLIKAMLNDSEIEKIYAIVRPETKNLNRLPEDKRIVCIECDMQDYQQIPNKINDECDVFYHLAWPRTATYQESYEDMMIKSQNIQTVLIAVKVAVDLKCRMFIGAGSQSEYGIPDVDRFSPTTPCSPVRADGILHLAACKLAMILAKNLGIDCIWMRIFSVYGIYDRSNSMIMTTVRKLICGKRCSFTAAEQKWDYLYADDAGAAFKFVGQKVSGSHIYCLGSGKAIPLREYISIIRDVVAPGTDMVMGEQPYPPEPVMNLCADISSLSKDTGWIPQTSFEEGISKIFEDMKNRKEKDDLNNAV